MCKKKLTQKLLYSVGHTVQKLLIYAEDSASVSIFFGSFTCSNWSIQFRNERWFLLFPLLSLCLNGAGIRYTQFSCPIETTETLLYICTTADVRRPNSLKVTSSKFYL